MTDIVGFVAINTMAQDKLPPATARSLKNILDYIEQHFDAAAYAKAITTFTQHTTDFNNPHDDHADETTYVELLNDVYLKYLKHNEPNMSFDDFIATYHDDKLIELMRCMYLNAHNYTDGEGTQTPGYSYSYAAIASQSYTPVYPWIVLSPLTSATMLSHTISPYTATPNSPIVFTPNTTLVVSGRRFTKSADDRPILELTSGSNARFTLTHGDNFNLVAQVNGTQVGVTTLDSLYQYAVQFQTYGIVLTTYHHGHLVSIILPNTLDYPYTLSALNAPITSLTNEDALVSLCGYDIADTSFVVSMFSAIPY